MAVQPSAKTVVDGLNYPTTMTFDDDGNMYVSEGGGKFFGTDDPEDNTPRILKIDTNNQIEEFFSWDKNNDQTLLSTHLDEQAHSPITDLNWKDDSLYVTLGSRVVRIDPDTQQAIDAGKAETEGLQSKLLYGPDGNNYYINYGDVENYIVHPYSGKVIRSSSDEESQKNFNEYHQYLENRDHSDQDWEKELTRRKNNQEVLDKGTSPRTPDHYRLYVDEAVSHRIAEKLSSIKQSITSHLSNSQTQYAITEGNASSEQAQSQESSFDDRFSF